MVTAVARLNWSRWVADCPRPGCANAEHFGRIDGHVGGLTGAAFRCSWCGLSCDAAWPPNVESIERIVLARPVPSTRNWEPGENLRDLIVENAVHGIVPTSMMQIAGDQLSSGMFAIEEH